MIIYVYIYIYIYILEKVHQLTRDNYRVRDLDEELLIAKEVSVRLHSELEKSEESRLITEKINLSLKQHLDTLKESLDHKLSGVKNKKKNIFHLFKFCLGNK